jgi:DHA2 family multidrug resistance protein
MLQRGIPQAYMVAAGFLVFFLFYVLDANMITPDTGEEHMFSLNLAENY